MAIHQLEEKIGSMLLVRTSKGVKMTPEGAVLYEYLDKALNLISTAERKYDQLINMEKGELRFCAGDTVTTSYLLPFVKKYMEMYPSIAVKVSTGSSEECLLKLKNGAVDFCFVNLPYDGETDDFKIKECLRLHGCVVGGSKFKELSKTGVEFEKIDDYPLVLLSAKSNTRKFIDSQAQRLNKVFNPLIEVDSSEIAMEFVRKNMGITMTFRELAKIDNKEFFEIPCNVVPPDRFVGIATLKNLSLSTAAKRFVELMEIDEE